MGKIYIEICCGSAVDVFTAAAAGADRAELSSCLYFGGLTPSVGELRQAALAGIPIMAMARCRQGGFCYTPHEQQIMAWDAEVMGKNGADGIVFGGLTAEGKIDREFCRLMVSASGGLQTVFHRAFDLVRGDWKKELGFLIDIGVTRVLTSGLAKTAEEGLACLEAMSEFAGGAVEILPAGGIRENNLARVCRAAGGQWVHSSAGRMEKDGGEGLFNSQVSFAPSSLPPLFDALSDKAAQSLVRRAAEV